MEKLDELISKLNTLPEGYISKKKINGKVYFYLQRKREKHIESIYIKRTDLEKIKEELSLREKLENEIESLMNNDNPLKDKLSKRDEELTGYIMMHNVVTAKVKKGEIVWKNHKICPLIFLRSNYLESFLSKRIIDETRANSRLLKKALNINNIETNKLPLFVYSLVVTDNYWFRPSGSRLVYEDVKFKSDCYSELTLKGDTRLVSKKPRSNPQLTLIGSYEKCWKLIDGEWWLYKVGNNNELFSELFCSKLASKLDIPTAYYEKVGEYIKTKNFADIYNFEPMSALAGEDDSYENVFNVCLSLGDEIAKQYLTLIYFDALVENVDRHNENLGFLRNKRNGKIVSLAPNFDNNISLISRCNVLNENREKFGLTRNFVEFLKSNVKALELFKELELVEVTEQIINSCIKEIDIKVDEQNISNFVLNGYKFIIRIKEKETKVS